MYNIYIIIELNTIHNILNEGLFGKSSRIGLYFLQVSGLLGCPDHILLNAHPNVSLNPICGPVSLKEVEKDLHGFFSPPTVFFPSHMV